MPITPAGRPEAHGRMDRPTRRDPTGPPEATRQETEEMRRDTGFAAGAAVWALALAPAGAAAQDAPGQPAGMHTDTPPAGGSGGARGGGLGEGGPTPGPAGGGGPPGAPAGEAGAGPPRG